MSKNTKKEKPKDLALLEQLRDVKFDSIKKNVSAKNPTYEYELEFVRRITLREKCRMSDEARGFFLGDYSTPFLTGIAADLFHCGWEEIYGEYYEFISKENHETKVPFYKLTLFKGKNDSNLKSYTSTITSRYFTNKKKTEDAKMKKIRIVSIDDGQNIKRDNFGGEVIDNPWFSLLIDRNSTKDVTMEIKVKNAFQKLPEREQLIIKLMVMDDASGLEAFEDLAPYLNPTKYPLSEWSDKQKQDAMALLKGRALKHLKQLI